MPTSSPGDLTVDVEQLRPPAPRRALVERPRAILIVDDDEDAVAVLRDVLELVGHTVRIAHDGASALALVEDFRPELAVLDLGLPMMDGFDLAVRLRARFGDGLKLIALTGYDDASDRRRTAEGGFSVHLVKPIDADGLNAAIVALFGDAGTPSA